MAKFFTIFMMLLGVSFAQSDTPMEIPENTHPLPVVGFGAPNAPVKVVMYHSLTCHHCIDFKLNKFPEFKKKYVDSGKVYFVFQDFPTDEFSLKLAIICWIGRDINKYLERSHLVMENFNFDKNKHVKFDWVNAEHPTEVVEEMLKPTGITSSVIQPVFDDKTIEDALLHDALTAGQTLRLNFAPGFTVNGKLVEIKDLDDTVAKVVADHNMPRANVPVETHAQKVAAAA